MTNKTIIILFLSLFFQGATAQNTQNVKNIVAKDVKAYRQKLEKDENISPLLKEFSIDTFQIEHTFSAKTAELVNSIDILEAFGQASSEYDALLNKYYNKLLSKLKGKDKKILITAQKAWISFRNAEQNVIGTIGAEQYSGGGTIQRDINEATSQELTKMRLFNIVNHLDRIVN
jgi:uncharacterized protein YecT (DUF1311 family)